MALTTKQQAFIEHYLRTWNASQAARDAGYSEKTARAIGAENLTKPDIQAAIQARLSELKMGADEVLTRLTEHARGSMHDFLRVDEEEITLTWSLMRIPTTADGESDLADAVMQLARQENVRPTDHILQTATVKRATARLDLLQAGQRGKLGLIKKYTLDEKGKVSIELYDAQAALQLLGRNHGLFSDTHMNVDLSTLSDAQLEELAAGVPLVRVLRKSKQNAAPGAGGSGD
ncbi:MAG TPA: terminase small subunit [Kouleothrix sp.]|nr:terminase small subunit [Kouleothrix sp.]